MKLASIPLVLLALSIILSGGTVPRAFAAGYADLSLDSVKMPSYAKQGKRVTATLQIKNYGTLDAVLPEGKELINVTVAGPTGVVVKRARNAGPGGIRIPAGASSFFDIDVIDPYADLLAKGLYAVYFNVNEPHTLNEPDYFNNAKRMEFEVGADPAAAKLAVGDIAIDSVKVDPGQGTQTTTFKFSVVIKNTGATKAAVEWVTVKRNDFNVSFNILTALPVLLEPGKTYTYMGEFGNMWAGKSDLVFEVNQGLPDLNRSNNTKTVALTVTNASGKVPMPVLGLSDPIVSSPKGVVRLGEDVYISATVTNSGDAEARFQDGTTVFKVSEVAKMVGVHKAKGTIYLPPGDRKTILTAVVSGLTLGPHTLGLALDPDNLVKESDETHHIGSVKVTVNGPDVGVVALLQKGQTPSTKDSLKIDATVKNKGPMKAVFPKGSHFLYYGAKGRTVSKMILANAVDLSPGQEYKTTLTLPPFATSPGSYNIEVWVDPVNIQFDPALADNRFSFPVTLALQKAEALKPPASTTPSTAPKVPSAAQKPKTPPKTVAPPPLKTPVPGR